MARSRRWFVPKLRRVKKTVLSRFRKAKKRNQNPSSSSSSSSHVGKIGCSSYLCFKQPPTSPVSDPNHPLFTCESLRVLMESNDFYSKDCNTHHTHIDIDVDNNIPHTPSL